MNHKLLLIFIIKVVYLSTLHMKILAPPTLLFTLFGSQRPHGSAIKMLKFAIYFWWMNADLIIVVRYSVGTLRTPVGKRVRLVHWS